MIYWRERIVKAVSTCGGVGNVPKAPGTAGSALAVLVYLWLVSAGIDSLGFFLLTVALTVIAILVGHKAVFVYGSRDPQAFVFDEFCGMFVTLLFFQHYESQVELAALLIIGFILFRALDIIKPLIIDSAQHLPGGYGIVLDDVLAGLIANLVLHLLWTLA